MKSTPQPISTGALAPADILTPRELAERLKVTTNFIYNQMRPSKRNQHPLPVMKMGKLLRFSWIEVSTWLLETHRGKRRAA
jgi:predicted DNA-binding transcriptional regulator AlpA